MIEISSHRRAEKNPFLHTHCAIVEPEDRTPCPCVMQTPAGLNINMRVWLVGKYPECVQLLMQPGAAGVDVELQCPLRNIKIIRHIKTIIGFLPLHEYIQICGRSVNGQLLLHL